MRVRQVGTGLLLEPLSEGAGQKKPQPKKLNKGKKR